MCQTASDTKGLIYQALISLIYASHLAKILFLIEATSCTLSRLIEQQPQKSSITYIFSQYFTMHFSNAAALTSALFSTIAFAAPSSEFGWTPLTATVQLANDQSGDYANVVIPVDGVKRPVQELWGNTAVAHNGLVFASTAQLTAFQQTTVCTITEERPYLDASLGAERTSVSLGQPVVDLCSAYIVCECEGMGEFF